MEQRKMNPLVVITAILTFLLVIPQVINIFTYLQYGVPMSSIITTCIRILISIMLGVSLLAYKAWPLFAITGVVQILYSGYILMSSVLSGFTNISLLSNVITILKWIVLIAIFVVCNTEFLPSLKKVAKVACFVPIILEILAEGVMVLYYVTYGYATSGTIPSMIPSLILAVLVSLSVAFTTLEPKAKVAATPTGEFTGAPQGNIQDAQIGMAAHILLMLFTCGIYNYVWIYRVTKATNAAPGEEYRNPTTKLLLCMFVPFYYIYWIYQSSKRIDKLYQMRGIASDTATLNVLLAIIIGIVPPILMQDKINSLC